MPYPLFIKTLNCKAMLGEFKCLKKRRDIKSGLENQTVDSLGKEKVGQIESSMETYTLL